MTNTNFSAADSTISMEDITNRIDELKDERRKATMAAHAGDLGAKRRLKAWCAENAEELAELEDLAAECAGHGKAYQWNGDWYPAKLISQDGYTFVVFRGHEFFFN